MIYSSSNEPIVQLLSRIKLLCYFTQKHIELFQYDETKEIHTFIKKIVNPINKMHPKIELKHKEIKKTINNFKLSKDILNSKS